MWDVMIFDSMGSNVSPFNCGVKHFKLWGSYLTQEEAIEVRNDLFKSGRYAKITYSN